jgi:hypothetical protein
MMAGDWLQGPYVYALYDSYGFSQENIAVTKAGVDLGGGFWAQTTCLLILWAPSGRGGGGGTSCTGPLAGCFSLSPCVAV